MKPLFYFTCMLVSAYLLTFTATAQVAVQWDETIGGSIGEQFSTALPTSDGGYLLAGSSSSNKSADKSEDSKGEADYWIVKVDRFGKKIWDKTIGGSGEDQLSNVIAISEGVYLLFGTSNSDASGDKSEDSKGGTDYWIVKLDQKGNIYWNKTFGGSGIDKADRIISTADGGYLLAGSSSYDISEDKSEDSNGESDYWIVKIDQNGNKLWDKTFGGNDDDRLSTALSTSDGGYLLGGTSNSDASGDKSEDRRCNQYAMCSYDYWIIKLDGQGNKIWDKTIGGEDSDRLKSTISTSDGGYLLAGNSNSNASGDKSEDRKAGCNRYLDCYDDYWIIKIDGQGNKIWDKTFGGIGDDQLNTALSTNDGGYLLAGSSTSNISADKSEDNKEPCYYYGDEEYFCPSDFWIVKIDEEGNNIWDKTIGGSLEDFLSDAVVTADGGFLLAGTSNSNASGDKCEDCKGGFTIYGECDNDYWVVKVATVDSSIQVQSLSLIDATNGSVLQPLQDGDTINLALASLKLSVGAAFDINKVGSVAFEIKGPVSHKQTESQAPFVLFGDDPRNNSIRNIYGRLLPIGNYSVTATPFEKINKEGKAGIPISASFTVIYESEVSAFDLYDAVSNQKIMDLTDGSIIYTDELEHGPLNVLIHTTPEVVGSVKVELEGPTSRKWVEKTQPYTLFRNYGNDLLGKPLPAGEYHLKATPYLQTKARGYAGLPLEISFTVVGKNDNNAPLAVYPVPTSGALQISFQGSKEPAQMMLLDFTGQPLMTLPLQEQVQLDLSIYPKGIYYLRVIDKEAVHLKRVVLE